MDKKRVALFGGQEVGYLMADYFSKRSDIDLFVVSFQTRRDIINGYRSALSVCKEKNIPFVETTKPYEDTHAFLEQWKPDIIVGAYYARLFPPQLLKIPRLGGINAHPGKFPRYRGPMPTPWYIINGEKTFGMGIFQIDEGIDTGPVFVEREYPIADDETGYSLLRRTQLAAVELYIEYFDPIVNGEIAAKPQEGEPLFCPRIEPHYQIDWTAACEAIVRRIRVHAKPYFPAYTFIYNRLMTINRAYASASDGERRVLPGQITRVWDDGRISIACGDAELTAVEYEIWPPLEREERGVYLRAGARLV